MHQNPMRLRLALRALQSPNPAENFRHLIGNCLNRYMRQPFFTNVSTHARSGHFDYHATSDKILPSRDATDWLFNHAVGGWDSCLDRDHNCLVGFELITDAVEFDLRFNHVPEPLCD